MKAKHEAEQWSVWAIASLQSCFGNRSALLCLWFEINFNHIVFALKYSLRSFTLLRQTAGQRQASCCKQASTTCPLFSHRASANTRTKILVGEIVQAYFPLPLHLSHRFALIVLRQSFSFASLVIWNKFQSPCLCTCWIIVVCRSAKCQLCRNWKLKHEVGANQIYLNLLACRPTKCQLNLRSKWRWKCKIKNE